MFIRDGKRDGKNIFKYTIASKKFTRWKIHTYVKIRELRGKMKKGLPVTLHQSRVTVMECTSRRSEKCQIPIGRCVVKLKAK
jgi:hypothetical protein